MLDVLSVGNVNVDFIVQSRSVEKEIPFSVFPGGSASNFAVGCARLGLKTGILGFIGDDYYGDFLLNNLEKNNVKTFLKKVDKPTSFVVIFSKNNFLRMFHSKGANEMLVSLDLSPYAVKTYHLHLATTPFSLLKYIKHFSSVSVDPGSFLSRIKFSRLKPYFKSISVFLPNEKEIESICGCDYKTSAQMILEAGCGLVVVKRGKKGCYAVSSNEEISLGSIPSELVDTTGAGDAFDSAFIYSWLQKRTLRECCLYALASSSRAVSYLGAQNPANSIEIRNILKKKNLLK